MTLSPDLQAFAQDLERLYTGMASLDSQVVLTRSQNGGAVTAALGLDDAQVNRLLLQIVQIGNDHGIRFPRELGMLLKQLLYFDRHAPACHPVIPACLGMDP
jgi:aarF domain-containing kinase